MPLLFADIQPEIRANVVSRSTSGLNPGYLGHREAHGGGMQELLHSPLIRDESIFKFREQIVVVIGGF